MKIEGTYNPELNRFEFILGDGFAFYISNELIRDATDETINRLWNDTIEYRKRKTLTEEHGTN